MVRLVSTIVMFVVLLNCALVKGQLNVQNKPSHSLDELSWLAGAWTGDVDGDVTEEQWLAPKAGIMVGVNRSVYRSGKVSFEFMRIAETPKGITYFASPGGRPATGFVAKEISESSAIFENLDNDFPQRVIYRRKEYGISARIEGMIDEKQRAMEWEWKRPVGEPTKVDERPSGK